MSYSIFAVAAIIGAILGILGPVMWRAWNWLLEARLALVEKEIRELHPADTSPTQISLQLSQQLESLGSLTAYQTRMQQDVSKLLQSMTNSRQRGGWGEAQLIRVVEAAGLLEHIHYETQVTNESTRPDMVLSLPQDRHIIIDSKAPMEGFLEQADGWELRHVGALKSQISSLAAKHYNSNVAGPEMVILFVPSEAALAAAFETDGTLLDYGARKRIVLASPLILLGLLYGFNQMWQVERTATETQQILVELQELYRRLETNQETESKMMRSLQQTVSEFETYRNQNRSRVRVAAKRVGLLLGRDVSKFESGGEE